MRGCVLCCVARGGAGGKKGVAQRVHPDLLFCALCFARSVGRDMRTLLLSERVVRAGRMWC